MVLKDKVICGHKDGEFSVIYEIVVPSEVYAQMANSVKWRFEYARPNLIDHTHMCGMSVEVAISLGYITRAKFKSSFGEGIDEHRKAFTARFKAEPKATTGSTRLEDSAGEWA